MGDKECHVVTKRKIASDHSLLPPRSGLSYFAGRQNDGADSCICAAGYGAAGFDGPKRSITQMLLISRGIAPPGVVSYDSHCFCPLAYIICIIFAINRFVADGAAHRDVSCMQE